MGWNFGGGLESLLLSGSTWVFNRAVFLDILYVLPHQLRLPFLLGTSCSLHSDLTWWFWMELLRWNFLNLRLLYNRYCYLFPSSTAAHVWTLSKWWRCTWSDLLVWVVHLYLAKLWSRLVFLRNQHMLTLLVTTKLRWTFLLVYLRLPCHETGLHQLGRDGGHLLWYFSSPLLTVPLQTWLLNQDVITHFA